MEVTVLHVSDTHLGLRQYGLVEREQDIYDVFGELVEIALTERVDLVVHSGDFFDTARPPMQAVRVAIDGLSRLREAGIPVVAVLGDHDLPRRREMPPLYLLEHLLDNVIVLGKPGAPDTAARRIRTRSGAEVFIAGLFSHRGVRARALPDSLARLPRPPRDLASVLVLHQGVEGAAPEPELSLAELPEGYSYYALGHVHVAYEARLGEARLVYPGAPEYMKVDEVGRDRSVVLATLSPRGTVALERLKLERARPQLVYEISYERLEEAVGEVMRVLLKMQGRRKKPLLHVIVRGASTSAARRAVREQLERLRNLVLDYRIVFAPQQQRGEPGSGGPIPAARGLSLRDLLLERLGDPEVAELAYQLISVLGHLGPTEATREAMRLTVEWFKRRYGVEP